MIVRPYAITPTAENVSRVPLTDSLSGGPPFRSQVHMFRFAAKILVVRVPANPPRSHELDHLPIARLCLSVASAPDRVLKDRGSYAGVSVSVFGALSRLSPLTVTSTGPGVRSVD